MITATTQTFFTSTELAKVLGRPLNQVRHVLATRRSIAPTRRAGAVRLYDASVVDQVRDEIDAIDRRRGKVAVP